MIGRFFKRANTQTKRRRKSMRATGLTLEHLEHRLNLNGDISAMVSSGDLQIRDNETGDAPAFVIAPGASADEVVVVPLNTTTINGQAAAVTLSGITDDWDIRLQDGTNTIVIGLNSPATTLSVPDDLVIMTGDGNDTIVMRNITVGDDVGIVTKGGNDLINIDDIAVASDVSIHTFDGSDSLTFTDAAVGGEARFHMGSGNDFLEVNNLLAGSLNIQTRSGQDQIDLLNLNVTDDVLVQSGNDSDRVTLFGSQNTLLGETTIELGSGDDQLTITNTLAVGPNVLDGGDGFDLLLVDDSNLILNGATVVNFEAILENTITFTQNNVLFNDIVLTDLGDDITITHVDNVNIGGGGDLGTLTDPHQTLASASLSPTDIVYVHSGTNFVNDEFVLLADQRLLGEGNNNDHAVETDQLGFISLPAVNGVGNPRPLLSGSSNPNGLIQTAGNSEVSNFSIQDAPIGIAGVAGAGEVVNINRTTITGGQVGVSISGQAGTFNLTGTTIADANVAAVNVVSGDSTVTIGGVDNGIDSFGDSSIIQTTGGTAVNVLGDAAGHTGSITLDGNSVITATTGGGLQFDNADGTYNFLGQVALDSAGISITNDSSGTFTFADTDINNSGLTVTDSSPNVSLLADSSINQPAGLAISVLNSSPNLVVGGLINGNIQTSGGAGTHVFSGPTTSSAIILNNSTGSFTFGAATSITTSGTPFGLLLNGGSPVVDYAGSIQGAGIGIVVLNGVNSELTVTGSSISMTGENNRGILFASSGGALNLNNVAIDMNGDAGTVGIQLVNLDAVNPINLSGTGTTVVNAATPTTTIDVGGGFIGTIEVNGGADDLP